MQLLAYKWPGNVRQLENFSERLVLARPRRALTARDFDKLRTSSLAGPGRHLAGHEKSRSLTHTNVDISKTLDANLAPAIEHLEREYVKAVLEQNGGRISAAAEQGGISRRTLLRKLKQYEIDKQEFKR